MRRLSTLSGRIAAFSAIFAGAVTGLVSVGPNAPEAAAGEALHFTGGCGAADGEGTRITVAAVGDLLFHAALQRQALGSASSYADFWQPVQHVLDQAGIVYGNLEGTVAEGVAAGGREVRDPGRRLDGRVYSAGVNEMVFNYHPSLAADLKDTGFDVVSTANNHGDDRGELGIDRTIDALEAEGLAFSGTRRREEAGIRPWSTVVEHQGVRVAFLACTYGTNRGPRHTGQMLNCYRDRAAVMGEIAWLDEDPDIDAVILTPHWGAENAASPASSDRAYARAAIEAGATAVIGAHPHVLQPWEKFTTAAGREGLVIYSTGNFISNQPWTANRSGIIAVIELYKGTSGKARISAAGFVPTWVERRGWRHRVEEMRNGNRGVAGALSATLRRLPAANRVDGSNIRALSRACPLPAITAANVDVAR